jgi:serine/threonine protein kinase
MPAATDFAGYTLTDEIGPCPGGTAHRATHPTRGTPVVVRRLRPDWLAPADDPEAFAARAREAGAVSHPHLARVLDAGVDGGEPFAVLAPPAGADLDTLVRDIGPMPTALACAFARQAAAGLAAAHAAGLAHGDVRPAHLVVGPLAESSRRKPDGTPLVRPAATAAAVVAELGLVPRRPPAAEWVAAESPPAGHVAYLSPERAADPAPTPAGDVYGLGAALFFLLAGRPPFAAATAADTLAKAAAADPPSLTDVRPDLPADLAWLVGEMLAKDPAARPGMAAVEARLAAFAAPPAGQPASDILGEGNQPPPKEEEPILLEPVPEAGGWTVTPYIGTGQSGRMAYTPPAAASESAVPDGLFAPPSAAAPRRAAADPASRRRLRAWFLIGAGFWVLAGLLWLVLLNQAGCFGGNGSPAPASPKQYRR